MRTLHYIDARSQRLSSGTLPATARDLGPSCGMVNGRKGFEASIAHARSAPVL